MLRRVACPANMSGMADRAFQQFIRSDCGATYGVDETVFACNRCGSLLDVRYDWSQCEVPKSLCCPVLYC